MVLLCDIWYFAIIFFMEETTVNNNTQVFDSVLDPELEEMAKAGVHLGHAKSKTHPSMQKYIFGIRNTIAIIDLTVTKDKLLQASEFIRNILARDGLILLVGTRPAARKITQEIAQKAQMPYFNERWIGGTLTNFKVVTKRVEYMESLEREKASGGFEKYTKKERLGKEEEMTKLRKNFDGLRTLKRLPDALFIVDINEDSTAVREARRLKIPVVALCDTNSNAQLVEYPIPANDDALPAVRYMINKIGEVFEDGQRNKLRASNSG